MATRPEYQKLIKEAKRQQIETVDELMDIVSSREFEEADISGGEFECAKKQLKLKS